MKKIFGSVIILGFVFMLGAAGSADVYGMSFGKVLLFEMSGMAMVLSGISALMHCKRYSKRMSKKQRRCVACTKMHKEHSAKLLAAGKELC